MLVVSISNKEKQKSKMRRRVGGSFFGMSSVGLLHSSKCPVLRFSPPILIFRPMGLMSPLSNVPPAPLLASIFTFSSMFSVHQPSHHQTHHPPTQNHQWQTHRHQSYLSYIPPPIPLTPHIHPEPPRHPPHHLSQIPSISAPSLGGSLH